MNIVNVEGGAGTFGSPSVYTIQSSLTAGNGLLVAIETTGNSVVSVSDDGGNTWLEDFQTNGTGTGDFSFYRVQTIGTVPTTISVQGTGSTQARVAILEVSDLATSPLNDTVAGVRLGFSTTHSLGYTTSVDGEVVLGIANHNQSSSGNSGASGTVLIPMDSNNRFMFYKDVTTAETGQIDFTTVDSERPYVALVSYQPAAAAASVPPSVFQNANQMIGY